MPKTNEEVEELLGEWAELLQITGRDPYRVRAYEKAARSIGGYSKDLRELDDKREMVPGGMRELLRIPGLGPKKAILVYDTLGVTTLSELAAAAEANKLQGIKGLGAKTEENLLRGIRNYTQQEERIMVDQALEAAERIIASLTEGCSFDEIAYAGSL